MLNRVTVMGRLARDPELKHTQSGTAVVSFSIAVDPDFKDKNTVPIPAGLHGVCVGLFPVVKARWLWRGCALLISPLVYSYPVGEPRQ